MIDLWSKIMFVVVMTCISILVVLGDAHAKHHKKKGHPTPKPTPSARIQNPVKAPDHAELRPEDLMWLNQ